MYVIRYRPGYFILPLMSNLINLKKRYNIQPLTILLCRSIIVLNPGYYYVYNIHEKRRCLLALQVVLYAHSVQRDQVLATQVCHDLERYFQKGIPDTVIIKDVESPDEIQ